MSAFSRRAWSTSVLSQRLLPIHSVHPIYSGSVLFRGTTVHCLMPCNDTSKVLMYVQPIVRRCDKDIPDSCCSWCSSYQTLIDYNDDTDQSLGVTTSIATIPYAKDRKDRRDRGVDVGQLSVIP